MKFSQPLCQFFQIRFIHPGNNLLTMNVMNCQNVIFVKDDLCTLIQTVQSSFCQWIIHDASKMVATAF